MEGLISREATYKTLTDYYHQRTVIQHQALREALSRVPSAEPEADRLRERCRSYERTINALVRALTAKTGTWLERDVFDEPRGKAIQQWQSAKCSVCGKYHTTPYLYYFTEYNYCPNCGADMREVEDE